MATAFWIVSQDYMKEALVSAASVARHMPDVKRILFSPDPVYFDKIFDQTRQLPSRNHDWWYLDSARYFGLAVEGVKDDKLLYFDADTYMCEPIYDVLEVLDKFDVAGTHAPGRVTSKPLNPLPIPEAFPEINVGVLGILRSDRTIWLMQRWYETYAQDPKRYNNNDQGALRQVLWENNIKLAVLPPEYNMRWGFGGFAKYKVKVLHGQTHDYEGVCHRLNSKGAKFRGWDRGDMD